METHQASTTGRIEVIRSPALYLGEIEVTEDLKVRKSRLLSGTRTKNLLYPLTYWFIRRAPRPLALLPLRILVLLAWTIYWVPNNLLRNSCVCVCRLANQAGYGHRPAAVYRRFLRNLLDTGKHYLALYRGGSEAVQDNIVLPPHARERIKRLLENHGGLILAVPHSQGSVLSGLGINLAFPSLLVSKNSATIERTRLALDFYERMGVQVLMVRGGNPFKLSKTLLSVLRDGKAVAATVDNVDTSANGVSAQIFGREVSFPAWAAKIALRAGVPVVPIYCHSEGERVRVALGEPILASTIEETVQHYVSFFEANILEDPASWSFLWDKKWNRVLQATSPSFATPDTAGADPANPQ